MAPCAQNRSWLSLGPNPKLSPWPLIFAEVCADGEGGRWEEGHSLPPHGMQASHGSACTSTQARAVFLRQREGPGGFRGALAPPIQEGARARTDGRRSGQAHASVRHVRGE